MPRETGSPVAHGLRGDGRPPRFRQGGAVIILVAGLLACTVSSAQTFDDAVQAYDAGQFAQAAKIFEPLAQQGHVLSQYNLGLLYENGQGVSRRPDLAFFWYRMAAMNGNDEARYNLGGLYFRGEGVERSLPQAEYWWTEAANSGDANAAYNLGVLLAGDGSDREALQASMIRLKQAADQGHPHASALLQDFARVVDAPESLFFTAAPDVPAIETLAIPGVREALAPPPPTPPPVTTGEVNDPDDALVLGRFWIDTQPANRYTVQVGSFFDDDVALWYLKKWGFGGPGAIYSHRGEYRLVLGSFASRSLARAFLARLREHVASTSDKRQEVTRFSAVQAELRDG